MRYFEVNILHLFKLSGAADGHSDIVCGEDVNALGFLSVDEDRET